LKEVIVVGKE